MNTNIVINGFFGRMGQAILEESLNIADVNIVAGCDINTNSQESPQVEVTNSLNKINKITLIILFDLSQLGIVCGIVSCLN